VTRPARRAVPLVGLASAPLGHLLAYQVRFAGRSAAVESSGAHAYVPLVVGTVMTGLAVALLLSLLFLAVARLAIGRRRGLVPGPRRPVLDLLPVLFTIQLAAFVAQECVEALATGALPDPVPAMLLWGTVGQLPVAVVAAVVLSWLTARLEAAVRELRLAASQFRPWRPPAVAGWRPAEPGNRPLAAARRARPMRGPPRLLDPSAC
jgi:hypothetical protein